MKINTIEIQNFKGFEYKEFSFNPNMTVLIGDNGTGKTTILDALSFVLGTFFIGVDGVPNRSLKQSEKRRVIVSPESFEIQLPFRMRVQHTLEGKEYEWFRDTNKENGRASYINAKPLIDRAKILTAQVREGKKINLPLPLVAYYGTARLTRKEGKIPYAKRSSRLEGYNNALNPEKFQYKFLEWFKTLDNEILKFKRDDDKTLYEAFTSAITSMIPEWKNIQFSWKADDMLGQLENGDWMPFGMLSDGYQNIIRLSADIAYRAIKLNPYLGENAVKETKGVVLIDEIDMHLHPKWQKTVIADFKRTFPNIQFIVTTHSPFIVQSLHADEIINLDENQLSQDPDTLSLEENALYMGVSDVNSDKFVKKGAMAEAYLRSLETGIPDDELLNDFLKEFGDDPVFIAKLKLERLAKLGK
jgi:predicted ATP-binding protein involved in virulence